MPNMTNRKECETLVSLLAARGHDVRLDSNSFGMRVETKDESRDISPRLSPAEMAVWLNGFICAIEEIDRRLREGRAA